MLFRSTHRRYVEHAVFSDESLVLREHERMAPVDIIENKDWKNGMGSSHKAGLAGLLVKSDQIDAVIVLVCDQPNLSEGHLRILIARAADTHAQCVASSYAGTVGVPSLFKRATFELIMAIDNESGAKKIIRDLGTAVTVVNFPGGETDLDTPGDYEAFMAGK